MLSLPMYMGTSVISRISGHGPVPEPLTPKFIHYGLPSYQNLLEALASESWNLVSFMSTVLSSMAGQENLRTLSLIPLPPFSTSIMETRLNLRDTVHKPP